MHCILTIFEGEARQLPLKGKSKEVLAAVTIVIVVLFKRYLLVVKPSKLQTSFACCG